MSLEKLLEDNVSAMRDLIAALENHAQVLVGAQTNAEKPKRTRKAAATAAAQDPAAESSPSQTPAHTPAPPENVALTPAAGDSSAYDAVKRAVYKAMNAKEVGFVKVLEVMATFKVDHASKLKPEEYDSFINKLTAFHSEPKAA